MEPTPNPLTGMGLLILLFLCGLVTFFGITAFEQEPAPPPEVITMEAAIQPEMGSSAANADVTYVRAVQTGMDTWSFYVTVEHPDTGWDDYADGWSVFLPDESPVLTSPDDQFTRLLLHPHENEQPFTRSQSGVIIPPDVATITVRAHDLIDGWGGRAVTVDLTAASGPDFEVEWLE